MEIASTASGETLTGATVDIMRCEEVSVVMVVVVRPNKSSEMKVSEVSPYRNIRCKKGNEGQGRGATIDTIRHVLFSVVVIHSMSFICLKRRRK